VKDDFTAKNCVHKNVKKCGLQSARRRQADAAICMNFQFLKVHFACAGRGIGVAQITGLGNKD
jgi:hypothetical protein